MGLKRIISWVLLICSLAALVLPAGAQELRVLEAGRISVVMPQITVELKGTGYTEEDITASLDAEPLTVERVADYDPATDTARVYILVDLSTSMWGCFDLVKKNIISFIENMSSDDQLILITFGEETVETVLSGGEEKDAAIAAVNQLQCNENGTLFFEALSRAYQLSNTSTQSFDREYVLAFSDGIDYQRGSTTFSEVQDQYDSKSLPLYAACSSYTSQTGADQFGQIARASGGSLTIVSSEADFAELLKQIQDVTLLRLRAATNHADGKEKQLTLKLGSQQLEYNIPIVRSQPDEEAPTVQEAAYDAQIKAFTVRYSEKVIGAENADAYKITKDDGTVLPIAGVYYAEEEDVYELRLASNVWNGSYTIAFSGITDASQQVNPLRGEVTIVVDTGAEPTVPQTVPEATDGAEERPDQILIGVLASVALLILIAVIVTVIVVTSRKKLQETDEQVSPIKSAEVHEYEQDNVKVIQHHIKSESSVRIQLRIVTGKASEQRIETELLSSLIVGRSATCDICIDDTKLSRQHFVLENDRGTLYIMDLQSRNGTMLNGIRISGRQVLHSGDRILAGLSDITISITGR